MAKLIYECVLTKTSESKTIILPVVLYGCETWSLTLREESRLRVFENRILRRIFGPRGMRMGSGEGSTMRNFIVCTVNLIVRVIKSRRLKGTGHVARMEKDRVFRILTGTPTGAPPSGREWATS